MKYTLILLLLALNLTLLPAQGTGEFIVTSDIDHFWAAYDKIQTTPDTSLQMQYLQSLFLEKGSEGLGLIMQARRYTPKEYLESIHRYPLFWSSIRENMLKAEACAAEIEDGVEKLKAIYPQLKPTNIYFTVGALRTPGTSMNKQLLIGSELAMADSLTITREFPPAFSHLKVYFANNPLHGIVFLNIHEYIHTQQNTEGGYDLLSQSLFEGIAEFVPVIAIGTPSPTPAIQFGKTHNAAVRAAFEREMFSPWIYNWIWNDFENEFNIRDLGYYVGYAVAEAYYENAQDKNLAIAELIQLDFNNPDEIEALAEKSGYFSKPIKTLKRQFEKSRPTVVGIKEFKNGANAVSPHPQQITIEFSEEMDQRFRSTDFGSLGKDYFPEIVSATFAENGKSITYDVRLKPDQKYQFVVERGFRTKKAIPLKPFVVEFTTAKE